MQRRTAAAGRDLWRPGAGLGVKYQRYDGFFVKTDKILNFYQENVDKTAL